MPTTSLTDSTFAVSAIGARTDAAGGAVADYTAEEARFSAKFLTEGYRTNGAFTVLAQSTPNMTVKVGSGFAKEDYYVVPGYVSGQGNYVVRLDAAGQNVTVPAADASQTRTDEVYLVVRDNVYDASSRGLPTIGYRKGDLGGANPGPDTAWKAYALLARITVPAGATSITNSNISDQRKAAGLSASAVNVIGTVTSTAVSTGTVTATGAVTSSATVTGADVKAGTYSLPRGIIARNQRVTDSAINAGANGPGNALFVLSVTATVKEGRRYRIYTPVLNGSSQTATHASCQFTYTTDGSAPTASSPRLNFVDANFNSGSQIMSWPPLVATWAATADGTLRVLLSLYTNNGALCATYARSNAPLELVVEDIGVDPSGTSGTVY